MSTVDFSSSNWTTFSITPLLDDGLNFTDYEPKIKVLCGAKGILKFLEGCVWKPKKLHVENGVFMKPGTIDKPATEEEIENAETKMDMYKQNEPMCKHILMSSILPHLHSKSNPLQHQMKCGLLLLVQIWRTCQCYRKWTLDAIWRPWSLHTENSHAAAHVLKMEAHFCLMQERVDELTTIGDPINARTHLQIALKFVWESYHTTFQTLDTADTLNGEKTMAEDVKTIFLLKDHHQVILKAETEADKH